MSLNVTAFDIAGPLLIAPEIFADERGRFFDSFRAGDYAAIGIDIEIAQISHSASRAGVLRGLHFQYPAWQPKLVRIVRGHVFDVAVDLRADSPTRGKWLSVELRADTPQILYLPAGFAHGFVALDDSELVYELGAPYDPAGQVSLRWDDPEIGIDWPLESPVLSPRDAAAPGLQDILNRIKLA